MVESGNCFNLGLIDTEKLSNFLGESVFDDLNNQFNQTTKSVFDENDYDIAVKNNKFNSFPMRKKNSLNSKTTRQSQKSFTNLTGLNAVSISEDELNLTVRLAGKRHQENNRLKNLLRNNFWPLNHPIRKYLWRSLLKKQNVNSNKENSTSNLHIGDTNLNENEYNKYVNQIFGKTREIDISLPDFVDIKDKTDSSNDHINYYFLNNKGKEAIKRILCVYEYHFPQVTFSPGLLSISSVLLHYMQEHEVFASLCYMSSSKEHLIESKTCWDTTCSVFIKLLKNYCKSSYDTVSKYAHASLNSIFNEWYWWIFDSLSFDYLVKIMDCFIFEGQKIFYRVSLAIVQQFSRSIRTINLSVDKHSIHQFCQSSANLDSVDKLLKVSFNIRNLKRSTIKEYYSKEENKRKNLTKYDINHNKSLVSIENNQKSSPTRIFLNEAMTSVLSHSNLCTVWNWIPQRLSICTPNMLFTTQENGTSLNTLFNVLDELEYCLIVIKTFDDDIFGAFCAGDWNQRKNPKNLFFGTGETFLFTLSPEKKLFKWVGSKQETKPNQEMFIRVNTNKISIGGGSKEGLAIKSNLLEGETNQCDTFANEPLCRTKNFQIAILEVVGFNNR